MSHGRQFFWRRRPISLYRLLLCEILLWKTRAKTVEAFIRPFLDKYPSAKCIARERPARLVAAVHQLGLSARRSRQLHRTFRGFSDRAVPRCEKEFRSRFGVGQYIARAVLATKYGEPILPVDQNIKRFASRVYGRAIQNVRQIEPIDDAFLAGITRELGPEASWAIIDLCATHCGAKEPRCGHCPIRTSCLYNRQGPGL